MGLHPEPGKQQLASPAQQIRVLPVEVFF
jgi:hypothetical protein